MEIEPKRNSVHTILQAVSVCQLLESGEKRHQFSVEEISLGIIKTRREIYCDVTKANWV